jgi:cytoskeletal protein RodZ
MIGPVLRQAREDRGLTLPAVAKSLLVTRGYLDAIECACWDTLPHEVYVKGYVKAYAAYLHIEDELERCLGSFCRRAEAANRDTGAPSAARGSAGRYRFPSATIVGFSSVCIAIVVVLAFFTIRQPASAISLFGIFSVYNSAIADIKKDIAATLAARPAATPAEVTPAAVKPAAALTPTVRVVPAARPVVRQEEVLPVSTGAEEDEAPDQAGMDEASVQEAAAATQ